jgi:hypothetical protein
MIHLALRILVLIAVIVIVVFIFNAIGSPHSAKGFFSGLSHNIVQPIFHFIQGLFYDLVDAF